MVAPSIRSGFPVVVDHAAAAPPYNNLTAVFSANAGDELTAVVCGAGLPTVVSRNSADTGPGTLVWIRRFVSRAFWIDTSYNEQGAVQTAIYTAVVPAGGVTERALQVAPTLANDGGLNVIGTVPARLSIIAVDNTNGVGAIAYKGSIAAGANSSDITTGSTATQTIKPFGNASLLIGGGWFVDGTAPTGVSGCTEIVAPGTNRMPVWTRAGGAPGVATGVGAVQTDINLWALGLIEYLPTETPKPTKKIFFFGDSSVEGTDAAYQHVVKTQDDLAPNFEVFNQGVWWCHVAQAKARWDAEKAGYPTIDVAFVCVGANDLSSTWGAGDQADLLAIYTDLDTLGMPLITHSVFGPNLSGAPAQYSAFRDWVIANSPAGSHVVNFEAVLDPANGYLTPAPAYTASDGQHFNAAGNTILGAEYSAWIDGLGLFSQQAYPNTDVTDGAWTPSTGTDNFACLDDATDTEWIASNSNTTGKFGLAPLSTPVAGTQTLAFRASGSPAKKLIATLIEGAGTSRGTLTVDPLTNTVTGYSFAPSGISNYGDLDIQFEIADATTPPTPSVSFGAIGTGINGTTSISVPVPTGIVAGNYLLIHVTSGATNSETPGTPAGWTLLATGASTDGTFGIDTGPRRATIFGKLAVGGETAVTVATTNGNTVRATMSRWVLGHAGYAWDVVAQGANDSTSGTGVSMTTAAIGWAVGDCAVAVTGQRVDSATQSAQALTAAGITFGARTNRAATAVTTGNDHRHSVDTFAANTAGTASVATTWAYTASAAASAGGVIVRLREVPPTEFGRVYTTKLTMPETAAGDPISTTSAGEQSPGASTTSAKTGTTTAAGAQPGAGAVAATKVMSSSATGEQAASGVGSALKIGTVSIAGEQSAVSSASTIKIGLATPSGDGSGSGLSTVAKIGLALVAGSMGLSGACVAGPLVASVVDTATAGESSGAGSTSSAKLVSVASSGDGGLSGLVVSYKLGTGSSAGAASGAGSSVTAKTVTTTAAADVSQSGQSGAAKIVAATAAADIGTYGQIISGQVLANVFDTTASSDSSGSGAASAFKLGGAPSSSDASGSGAAVGSKTAPGSAGGDIGLSGTAIGAKFGLGTSYGGAGPAGATATAKTVAYASAGDISGWGTVVAGAVILGDGTVRIVGSVSADLKTISTANASLTQIITAEL